MGAEHLRWHDKMPYSAKNYSSFAVKKKQPYPEVNDNTQIRALKDISIAAATQ